MQNGASEDVSILIATSLARRVVDAIQFPIQIKTPAARTQEEGGNRLGDAELEFIKVGSEREEGVPEISEMSETFAAGIMEMVQRVRDGEYDESSADPAQLNALRTLMAVQDANPGNSVFFKVSSDEIDGALSELVSKRSVSIDVEWVKVDVEKPLLTLSNPILISDMTMHVQAKVSACIKLLGKKYCASLTSPRIRLEARQGFLELESRAAKVTVVPRFKDLDIVVKIKIWKWTVKIKVGITGIVNKQLNKQGPIQVLDLSLFEQQIPFSSKRVSFDSFDFPADPKGLSVRASMRIG
ncbi:hypothetical protein [Xanthomonas sp. LMG 12460]|uniref:hypothetical protein n=1 Tax=Xanthomonas sp. LMG 12460 TaxID=1591132 RepID=UPI0012654F85|nr:hypothetical protein [Xanthomonas sp. LMG 12460]